MSARKRVGTEGDDGHLSLEYDSEDDPDYIPSIVEATAIVEGTSIVEDVATDIDELELMDINDSSIGMDYSGQFVNACLMELRKLHNKPKWQALSSVDLVQNYLRNADSMNKLLSTELDAIMHVIFVFTGITIFRKSDTKKVKVIEIKI